jgi:hypothetical protein
MRRMGKLSSPLLPSGLPAESVPTGPSLGLWELLGRLIKSRAADPPAPTPAPSAHRD